MEIITKPIGKEVLKTLTPVYFDDMVKAVVDIKQEIIGLHAELHADIEKKMLSQGSNQTDLWGINLYHDVDNNNFIEFDSLINIRPIQNNRSRDVLDPEIRKKIIDIVNKLIK